jgi:hypothetical protein
VTRTRTVQGSALENFMRRKQDRRQREVEAPRRVGEWAHPESAGLVAGEATLALREAGPVQRQRGSGWFEQLRPDPAPATAAPAAGGEPQPGTLGQAPRRRPRAWLLGGLAVTLAVTLAVGGMLGFAVGAVRSGGEPTSAPATRAPATRAPTAQPAPAPQTTPQTSAVVVVRSVASSACLETATRADQLIGLLIANQRSRAADLLVAYTVASRQCRKDASP